MNINDKNALATTCMRKIDFLGGGSGVVRKNSLKTSDVGANEGANSRKQSAACSEDDVRTTYSRTGTKFATALKARSVRHRVQITECDGRRVLLITSATERASR